MYVSLETVLANGAVETRSGTWQVYLIAREVTEQMSPGGMGFRWWHFSGGDKDSPGKVESESVSPSPTDFSEVDQPPELRLRLEEARSLLDECRPVLAGERYVRHSEGEPILRSVQALSKAGPQGIAGLEADELRDWKDLARFAEPNEFEAALSQNNRAYVDRQMALVQEITSTEMPRSLTEEQARAVAQDEDVTLVLAGAGTGKTSVIVGKTLYLAQGLDVDPSQILVLAFNRKAAEEMRERIPEDLAGVQVSTFHSFGRRVIAESDVAPTVSRLATDNFACTRALTRILEAMLA